MVPACLTCNIPAYPSEGCACSKLRSLSPLASPSLNSQCLSSELLAAMWLFESGQEVSNPLTCTIMLQQILKH